MNRFALAFALFVAAAPGCHRKSPPLPTMGTVPAFALTSEAGAAVSLADYKGHVWVADFVFTRCKASCPMLTSRMKNLSIMLDEGAKGPAPVKLVSFTVDPEHDTPDVLSAYSKPFDVNPARWAFLTGPTDDVRRMVSLGFHLGVTPVEAADGTFDIVHSNRFVLVDGAAVIRGYYDAEAPDELKRLARDAVALAKGD